MEGANFQLLANLVWELRFLSMSAQVAHWRVFGPTSYSDHQLYDRVYNKLNELLDPLAEKLTAFSEFRDEQFVNPAAQARYVYERTMLLLPELERALLDANLLSGFFYTQLRDLSTNMRELSSAMRMDAYLTFGLENMLADTADELETLVYFLERRSQVGGALSGGGPMIKVVD